MYNFGEYVREMRKRSRLTLKKAEELGVASNAYLSQLERGRRKRPHPDILKRMAEAYNVPLKELLIAAGYLAPETKTKSPKEQIEYAYQQVQNDPRVSHGTRRKDLKLNLETKRYIVKVYENLTGRKLL
jgi:HTH-type transcriptional regulator, competence development regulator